MQMLVFHVKCVHTLIVVFKTLNVDSEMEIHDLCRNGDMKALQELLSCPGTIISFILSTNELFSSLLVHYLSI